MLRCRPRIGAMPSAECCCASRCSGVRRMTVLEQRDGNHGGVATLRLPAATHSRALPCARSTQHDELATDQRFYPIPNAGAWQEQLLIGPTRASSRHLALPAVPWQLQVLVVVFLFVLQHISQGMAGQLRGHCVPGTLLRRQRRHDWRLHTKEATGAGAAEAACASGSSGWEGENKTKAAPSSAWGRGWETGTAGSRRHWSGQA